jgi:hypothetical protein
MTTEPLRAAERANAFLGLAVAALCGIAWGPKAFLSAGVGAVLAAANLRVIRRLASSAVDRVLADPGQTAVAGLLVGMLGKMVGLFVLVALALRIGKLDLLPFTLGIMVFVLALLVTGLWWGRKESKQGAA